MDGDEEFSCPYCGSSNCLERLAGTGVCQWVQDCEICCRPIAVRIRYRTNAAPEVTIERENA